MIGYILYDPVESTRNDSFNPTSLALRFYLPSGLAFLGNGLAIPLLALYARYLGLGNAGAAFVVGLVGLGNLVFNIPTGQLFASLGIRRSSLFRNLWKGFLLLALALIGGGNRLGNLLGPIAGGFIA